MNKFWKLKKNKTVLRISTIIDSETNYLSWENILVGSWFTKDYAHGLLTGKWFSNSAKCLLVYKT